MPAWPLHVKTSRSGGIGVRGLPRNIEAESGREYRGDKAIGGQETKRVWPDGWDLGGVSSLERDEGAIVSVPNQIWT